MADLTIQFTIPEAKIPIVRTGFLRVYPNIEREEPTEFDADGIPTAPGELKYTDVQWLKEVIRRYVVSSTRRGLQAINNDNAVVELDDEVAS